MVNQRQLDLLDAQLLQSKAQVGEADAQSTLAQIALGYTRIVSPIDGTLGVREVREGALLSPGTEVDTITPLDLVFVTANFTERQITNIRLGQRAIVRVDAFRTCPSGARSPASSLLPARRSAWCRRTTPPGISRRSSSASRSRSRSTSPNAPDRAGAARHVRAGRGGHRTQRHGRTRHERDSSNPPQLPSGRSRDRRQPSSRLHLCRRHRHRRRDRHRRRERHRRRPHRRRRTYCGASSSAR